MPALDRETCELLIVDFQAQLMPVIDDGAAVAANAWRLLDRAEFLGVPPFSPNKTRRALAPLR